MRVLHRRTLLARPKVVHSMRAERINPHYMTLHLITSAGTCGAAARMNAARVGANRRAGPSLPGTYVKEFVHGDLGRTRPSLGELLGCDVDILQLDVTGLIMGDDPVCGEDAGSDCEFAE